MLSQKNKFFALKKLHQEIANKEEFYESDQFREAKIFFTLPSHQNIIKFEESFFDESNHFYLVLELCEGGDLETKIKKAKNENRPFSVEVINKWSKQLITGLEFLHNLKIIHRDIKPANILLDKDDQLKIGDFGAAKHLIGSTASTIIGTIHYMSPEMIKAETMGSIKITNKIDIWSAGVVIYELTTLKYPFIRNPIKMSILNDPIPELEPNTSEHLKQLIKRMLVKDAEKRADCQTLKQV